MQVIIDEEAGKVYVKIHEDRIETEVTRTLEKHGLLLHWDGRGKLMGVEFLSPNPDEAISVRYAVMDKVGHA